MNEGPRLRLFQFPISHYCEKARWALDYKGAAYEAVNLPPGLHKILIKREAPSATSPITVPLLLSDDRPIQGSARILSFLDRLIPAPALGFNDEDRRKASLELEAFLDESIATLLRSIAYNMLLKDRKCLIAFWNLDSPFYTRAWLMLALPYLANALRRFYRTDDRHLAAHQVRFNTGMDRLDRLCESKPFLIGERFSRADLTLAAILAPLDFPREHPYPNPRPMPEEFQRFSEQHAQRPVMKRVASLYRDYRKPALP